MQASDGLQMKLNGVRYDGAFGTYASTPSSNSIIFEYVILHGQWSSDLRLQDPQNTFIVEDPRETVRRVSTFSITDANLSIPWSDFSDLPQISIDGRTPRIVEIKYVAGQGGSEFNRGDQISIVVEFSLPVILLNGPPVLIINAGGKYNEAVYDSGNQTASLVFVYTIVTGDGSSPALACSMLCVATGCLEGASEQGYIMQMSASPTVNADILLRGNDFCKYSTGPSCFDSHYSWFSIAFLCLDCR